MRRRDALAAPIWPRISFAALVGLAAVLAAAVGLASTRLGPFAEQQGASAAGPVARPAPEAATSAPVGAAVPHRAAPAGPGPDWPGILALLDATRAAAFAAPSDASRLTSVDVAWSTAWQLDDRRRAQLAAAHLHASGLRMTVTSVRILTASPQRVRLAVTDRRAAYDLLDAGGAVVEHALARGDLRWVITLLRVGDGWRITEVAAN